MRKLLIAFSLCAVTLTALTGCESDNTPMDKTSAYVLPESLKDCTISEITGDTVSTITVTRCPLSNTVTSYDENCGKGCVRHLNNSVIDERKPPDPEKYVEIDGVKYKLVKE